MNLEGDVMEFGLKQKELERLMKRQANMSEKIERLKEEAAQEEELKRKCLDLGAKLYEIFEIEDEEMFIASLEEEIERLEGIKLKVKKEERSSKDNVFAKEES